jgi:hypothetical protein
MSLKVNAGLLNLPRNMAQTRDKEKANVADFPTG